MTAARLGSRMLVINSSLRDLPPRLELCTVRLRAQSGTRAGRVSMCRRTRMRAPKCGPAQCITSRVAA